MQEYPTLTALMAGREPGSVKVRNPEWSPQVMFRPGVIHKGTKVWDGLNEHGHPTRYYDESGPWLIVSEDAPALDMVRLQTAATILAGLHSAPAGTLEPGLWSRRHAYALAEADALIEEARK